MKIEIKNRWTGKILFCGEYENIKDCLIKNRNADLRNADLRDADLQGADLQGADLRNADLRDADLRDADLQGADLRNADLRDANLRNADLQGADLQGANLRNARIEEPLYLPDLYALKLFPENTKLIFWKYLENGRSPYQNFVYEVEKTYTFEDGNKDERQSCGKGGNVATLIWCLKDSLQADEFIEVEFKVKDILAIPFATDGKFRVKKFKVLRKINRKQAVKLLKDTMK